MYDRDVVGSDDFMGRAVFDLTSLELDTSMEVSLHLDHGGDEDLIRSPISKISTSSNLDMNGYIDNFNYLGKTRRKSLLVTSSSG